MKTNLNVERGKQLAKNTIIITFGTLLPKILSLITLPIVTACLTKIEYGTYDLICVLESLFLPCVTLQIQTAAFRFLIEVRNNEQNKTVIVSNVFFFIIVTSLIAIILCFFCISNYSFQIKLLISCFFLFDILKNTEQQIARGLSMNIIYSASSILYSIINVVIVFICVYSIPLGLSGVILSLLLSSLGSLIYLFIKLKIYNLIDFRLISYGKIREMIQYSWPMIPNSLSLWIMNLSNRVVITFFIGLEANAVFAVANKLPLLFSVIQSTFTLAWQENASIASKDNDAGIYYSKMFDTIYRLMVGGMALLIASTPVLFIVLIRGDYYESYNQIPILFLGVFFNVVVAFLGGIYVAMKKTKSVGITSMYAALINIFFNLILIKYIGLYAASISIVISYFCLALYRMRDIQKYVHVDFNYKLLYTTLALLILMCILCFQRDLILNLINLILSIIIFITYNKGIILRLFKFLSKKYRRI